MGVHGDDIVRTIREALADERRSGQAPSQSEVRITPNPAQGWPNRDGSLTFDCVGRDRFRVTVEVLPAVDEVEGELGSAEWVVLA